MQAAPTALSPRSARSKPELLTTAGIALAVGLVLANLALLVAIAI